MNKRWALSLFAITSCSSAGSTHLEKNEGRQEPAWLQRAVAESLQTMESRCLDHAPLEIIFTDDPLFAHCLDETETAARHARELVFRRGLNQCLAHPREGCCFERVTNDTLIEQRWLDECNRECAQQTNRADIATQRTHCKPQVVSLFRPPGSRAHTPAVEAVLTRCTTRHEEVSGCDALPTSIERRYCKDACKQRSGRFDTALMLCIRLAREEGSAISCQIEPEETRRECQARCQQSVMDDRSNSGLAD